MKPTYTFSEIVSFIHDAQTSDEVKLIAEVFFADRDLYAAFYALLIDHALNTAYYLLQLKEQNKKV